MKKNTPKALTQKMVLSRSRSDVLDAITKLNVWGQGIVDISLIKEMTDLEVISMSANKIVGLEPFSNCSNLRELYLRKNNITHIEEIFHLKELPCLMNLWLADNPCSKSNNLYRPTVIRNLEQLQILDDQEITAEEREAAETLGELIEGPPKLDSEILSVFAASDANLSSSIDNNLLNPVENTESSNSKESCESGHEVRSAVLQLVQVLDSADLLLVQDAVQNRLNTVFGVYGNEETKF